MQLQTILNRVEKNKSFVYGKVEFREDGDQLALEVSIAPRANGRPICSKCGKAGPCYDHRDFRRFEFVPVWGILVFFVYRMRRVSCPQCGVTVEQVPWAQGKQTLTRTYQWFLANWAKRLSWQETATVFRTSWQSVYRAVRQAVLWGIVHDVWSDVRTIGVDEIAWQKGHKYLTMVYQLDEGRKRLLWIGKDRKKETLERFFNCLGKDQSEDVDFVCSDMWDAYLDVVSRRAPEAVHILDRFHIMKLMSTAIDEVRRIEVKELEHDGYEPILKHSRWALLKRPENRTAKQTVKIQELMRYNLKSVKAHLQREDFQRFWEYSSPTWAGKFLEDWCTRVMQSNVEPMKKVARTLRKHRDLILNWFKAGGQLSSGTVEGFNNKAKLTMRKAYGFRSLDIAQTALYHTLSDLPEPIFAHRFW